MKTIKCRVMCSERQTRLLTRLHIQQLHEAVRLISFAQIIISYKIAAGNNLAVTNWALKLKYELPKNWSSQHTQFHRSAVTYVPTAAVVG